MTSEKIEILSLNISKKRGAEKKPVKEVDIDNLGIIGDGHRGNWHRQITLLSKEIIDEFCKEYDLSLRYGDFAENITIKGLDLRKVCILDRFKMGEAEIEVTQIGKKAHDSYGVFLTLKKHPLQEDGIYCRVVKGGKVKVGDEIEFIPKPLQITVITISSRSSNREYKDKSGPEIKKILKEFFRGKRWQMEIKDVLIPDNESLISKNIQAEYSSGADVIITTGGTGVGPHDLTPDVVAPMCDKIIPGIMEYIRIKYGEKNPNALLSRGIAGIIDKTLVFTIPGSVKAVREYMEEILKILEHTIYMMKEIDVH